MVNGKLFIRQQKVNVETLRVNLQNKYPNPNKVKSTYLHRRNQKKITQRKKRQELNARFRQRRIS